MNDEFNKDPSAMWKTLKDLKTMGEVDTNKKFAINPMKWINHLENLIGTETKVFDERKDIINEEIKKIHTDCYTPCLDDPITEKELKQECKMLKNKKSSGKDKITNEIIKASLDHMTRILVNLLNIILTSGNYPKEWKSGISVPLHKKGDPMNQSNYRGITLSSNLGKLFCKIINTRINNFLEEKNILIKEQAGFRKGYRTIIE